MSMKLLESPVRTRVDPFFFFCICCLPRFGGKGYKQDSVCPPLFVQIELHIDLIYVAECVFEFSPRCELIFFVCMSQVEQEVKVTTWITSLPHLLSLLPLLPPKNCKKKALYCTNAVILSL